MKRLFLTLTLSILFIPFGISQDLPSYVPTDGLVAYYPFNGNANDESGNGNDGVNTGAVLASDRHENQDSAYYFSGSNCSTRIDVDVDTSSIETNQSFSVSLWYKHNGGGCGGPRLMEFWPGSDSYGKFTVNTNKNLDTGSFSPNIDYRSSVGRMGVRWDLKPEEEWTHLVYTIDQSSYKIYQNGELLTGDFYNEFGGQTSGTIKLAPNGAFGRMNHSAWDAIDGYLDDIGIWNRVLDENEIQNLYTSSTGDIILNGVVSAENNQIKNVADPSDAQDAVTLNYLENGNFYTQNQVDNLLDDLRDELGNQIDNDGDGYTEDDGDCNDSNNLIFPGASEFEDAIDNDCDGEIDESAVYEFNHPANFLNGLIAYYPFTDGITEDFSGNGNHGIANNVNSNQDRFGTSDAALYFTNTGTTGDSFVSVTNLETTSISNGLTISLWAKIDGEGLNIPRIIDFGSNNEIGSLYIQAPNGDNYTQTRYNAPSNTYQRHVLHNNNGQWNQYAFSAHSDGQYRIYLNGQLDRMIQISQGELSLADLLSIGASNDGVHAFRGWIDDVSIHNRVLADSEILAIFNMQE